MVTAPDGVRSVGKIAALVQVAQAETHITDNHIVGIDHDRSAAHADAVAGSGLTGNGQVSVFDAQVAEQLDRTCHIEDDDAFARRFGGGTERARARIIEVGHMVNLSAAASAPGKARCTPSFSLARGSPRSTPGSTGARSVVKATASE